LQHEERAFVLKFSAIEIYNEVVRDLLSAESTSLRLWDDAEVRATNSYIFNFLEKRKREEKVSYCPHALIMVLMLFISTEGNICGKPYRGDLEGFGPPERTYFCV